MLGPYPDLKLAVRQLRQRPLLTGTVILSLAFGIGINVSVFSLVNGLFLKPLPGVSYPDRVIAITTATEGGPDHLPVSHPNYLDLRERSRSFSGLAAHQGLSVRLSGDGAAESVTGEMATANLFEVLGVQPSLGRFFEPKEDRAVVVLGYGLWQRRFDGDRSVLGQQIEINGQPFTVVGVAPEGFRGVRSLTRTELWVPLGMYRSVFSLPQLFEQRSGRILNLLGRLKPGVSPVAAEQEMTALYSGLVEEFPDDNHGQSLQLASLPQAAIHPNFRRISVRATTVLTVAVGLLLMITCGNVAHLLLARATTRRREIAIRLAVGAGRGSLARLLLMESLLLALCGGLLGGLLAWFGRSVLWALRPPYLAAEAIDLSLDHRVLFFTFAISAASGLVSGLAPMIQSFRTDLVTALADGPGSVGSSRRLSPGGLLVALQVALCTVALGATGFFVESLGVARNIDPGFSTAPLVTASFSLPPEEYGEAQGRQLRQKLLERVSGLPGVVGASYAENRLLGGFRLWREVILRPSSENGSSGSHENGTLVGSSLVDSEYFDTTGITLLRGRPFAEQDQPDSPPVVIVNELFAQTMWPGEEALAQRFRLDHEAEPVEVVGVARTSSYMTLGEKPMPFLYLPMSQRFTPRATLHVRTATEEATVAGLLREQLRSLDEGIPVQIQTLSDVLDDALWLPRTSAWLLGIFGVLALLLAGVGLYGVSAHATRQRGREIEIRLALGARRRSVLGLFLKRTLGGVGGGFLIGLALYLLTDRWLSRLLFGAAHHRGAIVILVGTVLLVTGAVAGVVPVAQMLRKPLSLTRTLET